MEPNKYTKISLLEGTTFKITLNSENFNKGSLLQINSTRCKVKKIYKFTKWKQFLFWLGFSFKSMELEEIKDGK